MAQYVYTMQGVSKLVPPKRVILENINLSFFPGAKIGVLGLNGAGKSSLLRIMAGEDREIEGEARPQKDIRVGYLPQEPRLDPELTVRGNVERGLGEVMALLNEFKRNLREVRAGNERRRNERVARTPGRAASAPSTPPTAGTSTAPWKSPRTPCACHPGNRT